MPTVSVIVPVYNVEEFIDECVKSILMQDFKDFELLLIDDGSQDKSLDVCKKWGKCDKRIKVYTKENEGLSATRNFGITVSTGLYITFIDSDDYISKDYISYLVNMLKSQNNCSIATCNRQIVKNGVLGHKFHYCDQSPIVLGRTEVFERGLYSQIAHGAVARLYKREVFDNIRYPINVYHEDTYTFGDIINYDNKMIFGNKVCYFYRVNDNSISHSISLKRLNDLILSTEKFAKTAVECDSNLYNAAICKISHSKLTVLGILCGDSANDDYKIEELKRQLKNDVILNSKIIIRDKQALKRDKLAIVLLKIGGLELFNYGFKLYRKCIKK